MAYSAALIADYFLSSKTPLTSMQVLKLVYIAHGYAMAYLDRPLIDGRIEAWRYGPVIPALYHALKGHGGDPINRLIYCDTPIDDSKKFETQRLSIENALPRGVRRILDAVMKTYSHAPKSCGYLQAAAASPSNETRHRRRTAGFA